MLDAGGDPNGRDVKGQPIVFDNWFMEPFKGQRPQRLRLLLDRGTDVNSVAPFLDRFSLLLYCAHMGAVRTAGLRRRARTIEPQRRFQIRRR